MGNKIVITGSAGFVGTNLMLDLLREGRDVVGVDSLSRGGTPVNLATIQGRFPNARFERKEIEDMASLIYQERPDVVFHFAAQVAVTTSVASPIRDFRINAEGSFLIANACQNLGIPIIYTSTNKVYGDNVNEVPIQEQPTRYDFAGQYEKRGLDEKFSIDARHHTPYGISKLVGEMYVREFGGIANRCSCMYGPNQFGIVDQGWLSHIAISKFNQRPVTIYGDGKQVRDALHIADVVRLLKLQMNALLGPEREKFAGEVFNVGGGYDRTISLLELCDRWQVQPAFGPWRPADQKVFYCDVSKAEKLLGWKPQVSLADGVDELLQWTKDHLLP